MDRRPAAGRNRRALRHAHLCVLEGRARSRLRRLAAGAGRSPRAGVLCGEGQLEPRHPVGVRAPRRRLRHRLGRRTRARARRRRTCRQGRVLRRRQDPRRDAPGPGGRHPLLQRRIRRRARAPERGRRRTRQTGADRAARQSRRRPEDPPLHLHRAQGQQVRRRLRRCARPLPPRRRATQPAHQRRRLPYRLATARPGADGRGRAEAARPGRSPRRRRHRAGAHRPRRRTRHPLPRRDPAGGRRLSGAPSGGVRGTQ